MGVSGIGDAWRRRIQIFGEFAERLIVGHAPGYYQLGARRTPDERQTRQMWHIHTTGARGNIRGVLPFRGHRGEPEDREVRAEALLQNWDRLRQSRNQQDIDASEAEPHL